MKIQRFVFALAFLLANVGFIYAEPITSDSKVVKPTADVADINSTQSPSQNPVEQGELFPKIDVTYKYQIESLNLTFSNDEQPDTTNFSVIEYYIKNVAPLTKKVGCDSKSIGMIEEMLDVL